MFHVCVFMCYKGIKKTSHTGLKLATSILIAQFRHLFFNYCKLTIMFNIKRKIRIVNLQYFCYLSLYLWVGKLPLFKAISSITMQPLFAY